MPANLSMTDAPGAVNQERPLYQGGAFTDISSLGQALGGTVGRDPATGRHMVNGQYVPWTMANGGQYRASVRDIVSAVGGHRVDQAPDGSLMVFKNPTPGPAASPGSPGATQPVQPVQAPPSNPLRALATGMGVPPTQAPSALPPGFQYTPAVTPAAQQLGAHAIASTIGSGEISAAQVAANGQAAGLDPAKQFGYTSAPAPSRSGEAHLPPEDAAILAAERAARVAAPAAAAGGPMAPAMAPDMSAFGYQPQPLDYGTMQQRAQMEAQLWAAPYLQQLRDSAAQAQQRADNQRGYIAQGLQDNIADLRAGEPARERRLSELMNQRGDALYGSGVHLGAIRDQQVATIQQEGKLSLKATNALQKLSDSLGISLQQIASRETMIRSQQGNRAILSLQQLADKAQTREFENRKLTWQMYMQGSRLSLDEQKQANELWMSNQRIKSQDDRATADRALKLAIANGQIAQKYTEMMGEDASGNPTFAARKWAEDRADNTLKAAGYVRAADGSLVRSLDGRKFDQQTAEYMAKQTGFIIGMDGKPVLDGEGQPVQTLDGAKFDFEKRKFTIQENWKESYQGALLKLKQDQAIDDKAYKQAQQEIAKGNLSVNLSRLMGHMVNSNGVPMTDGAGNPIPVAKPPGGNPNAAGNAAWHGVLGELGTLTDPLKASGLNPDQRKAAAQAIVSRWLPQLSPQEQQSLKAWLKANSLM